MALIDDPRLTAYLAELINARARTEGPRGARARADFAREAGVGPKQAERWFSPLPPGGREFPLLPAFLVGRAVNATLPDGMRFRLDYGLSLLRPSEIGVLRQRPAEWGERRRRLTYHDPPQRSFETLEEALERAQQYRLGINVDSYLAQQWFEIRIIRDEEGGYIVSIEYQSGVSPGAWEQASEEDDREAEEEEAE